uniref:Calponin-homology (CH) domain-containing protein n=1 Tax=Arcella intermedia TaxID=1963864 RepID=A0A6B2L541_9EUKA
MLKVESLQTDFGDGLMLINLLEIISSKSFPKYNKQPRIQMQKLENLTFALKFLESEGIKLVSIDSNSIASGNLKLILGLIWTIILRYQIQVSNGASARQDLLDWVRSKIPEYNINNFMGDWQDGKAICALAEAVLPGQMNLPRDFSNDAVKNANMGMKKAKDNMGIPEILDAEDMVYNPDELSNMTYISYFRDYLDLESRKKDEELAERTPVPAKCLAYGPGLEPNNLDTGDTSFTIEARDKNGKPMGQGGDNFVVDIQGPTGPVEAAVVDNGDGTYTVTYAPKDAGAHDIAVTLDDVPIKGSTFHVDIKPGAWAKNTFLKDFSFVVQTRDKRNVDLKTGGQQVGVEIKGPKGPVNAKLHDNKDGTYTVVYDIKDKGDYNIHVTVDGDHVKGSPFKQTAV